MSAPRVRTDYEQLNQVAQNFAAASDAATTTLQSLQQNLQVLEGGDWIGQGARAFYQEMSQAVLPTMKRLVNALQSAQQTTQAISREMKQAEDAAAAVLRGSGSGQAGQAGAPAAFAAASDSGGGFWSGVGDFFGGVWDEASDMVGGLWHAVSHPIDTIKGLAYAVTHPAQLWDSFTKPFVDAWESGHPWTAIGRGALFVGSLFIGAGEVGGAGEAAGAAGKAAELARAVEVADALRVAKAAEAARMASRFADSVEAAKALRAAVPGSPEGMELASYIARESTHIQEPATRVVLGKWEEAGGYIAEAKANGGVWYETQPGVYDAAGKAATWSTNEAFLNHAMEAGVDRLEFHGLDIDRELLKFDGVAFEDAPARVKEIRYMMDHAADHGYVRDGNSFVKLPAASSGVAQGTARAGVAGAGIDSAVKAEQP